MPAHNAYRRLQLSLRVAESIDTRFSNDPPLEDSAEHALALALLRSEVVGTRAHLNVSEPHLPGVAAWLAANCPPGKDATALEWRQAASMAQGIVAVAELPHEYIEDDGICQACAEGPGHTGHTNTSDAIATALPKSVQSEQAPQGANPTEEVAMTTATDETTQAGADSQDQAQATTDTDTTEATPSLLDTAAKIAAGEKVEEPAEAPKATRTRKAKATTETTPAKVFERNADAPKWVPDVTEGVPVWSATEHGFMSNRSKNRALGILVAEYDTTLAPPEVAKAMPKEHDRWLVACQHGSFQFGKNGNTLYNLLFKPWEFCAACATLAGKPAPTAPAPAAPATTTEAAPAAAQAEKSKRGGRKASTAAAGQAATPTATADQSDDAGEVETAVDGATE